MSAVYSEIRSMGAAAEANPSLLAPAQAAGSLIEACRIDLPKNDIVEAIEYERFFRLNLQFGELHGGATLPMDSRASLPAAQSFRSVPFSSDKADWQALNAALPEAMVGVVQRSSADQNRLAQTHGSAANLGSMSLALYLPFRQEWELLGYSRGRLVSSFTLGPQEEQTIEIFKWDRISRTLDSSSSFESEEGFDSSSTRRDTADVAREVARQTGFEANSQGKVGFQVGVVDADISAGFNARTGVNNAEKETRSAISEATTRSTGRVRTSRTLKVVESREQGEESRVTRKLRNSNSCHTLTVAFLEILASYRVSTFVRGDAARLVVLIDSSALASLDTFTRAKLRAHESPLRLALMDRRLADGFDAARFLDARDRACAVLCGGCLCGGASAGATSGAEWTAVAAAASAVSTIVNGLVGYVVRFPLSIQEAFLNLSSGVTDIKRHLFFKSLRNQAPRLLTDIAALGLGAAAASISVAQVESMVRLLAALPPDALPKLVSDKDVSSAAYWDVYGYVLSFVLHDPISSFGFTETVKTNSGGFVTFDDAGLVGALNVFKAAYENWRKVLQAQIDKDEKAAALQKIERQERELRVLEAYPLRETSDAAERLDALLEHVNDPRNLDHYRFAVWNERSGATDSTLIGLALAGLIEPTPVGMVGDQLAVPVKMTAGSPLAKFFADSIVDLGGALLRDEQEHILPTSALHAEAVLGTCCSCEDTLARGVQLDLENKALGNKALELEIQRLTARLAAQPAMLDREASAPPAILVDVANHAAAETPVA